MSFLSPMSFTLFGLAVPIIALYILKLRRRREIVSTMMFWEQIFKENRTTILFRRLKNLISLLLQLLFLTLLVLALARPQFAFMTRSARQIILIVDRSASMNATGESGTLLDEAKRRAIRMADNLRFIDEMMVISCHNRPTIHTPFTNHRKTLRRAISSIQPTEIRTDLEPALELAYSVAQTKANPEVVILSDFQQRSEGFLNLLKNPPEKVKLHLLRIGAKDEGNVGIIRFRVRRSPANAFDYQILLTVKNTSDEERKFNVELYLDDLLFDVRPYKLSPGESRSEIFSNIAFEGGRLKAVLDIEDPLPSDNIAYALLPRRRKVPVLLVTEGNLFLESALAVDETLDLKVIPPETYKPDALSGYKVVIFDRWCPSNIGDGNYILIHPPEGNSIYRIDEPLKSPIITGWDRKHPILRFVNLENVQIAEAYRVIPPDNARVLVRSFEDPLIFVEESPGHRVLFIALDILKSDLPLRVAFPVIIANAIQWFRGRSETHERWLRTGDVLQEKIGMGVGEVTLMTPDGESISLPVKNGEIFFDGTSKAGFYTLQAGDKTETWAVNLTDENETDLHLNDEVKRFLDREVVLGGSPLLRYPPWIHLIFLAVALSVTEWLLYQRRRIE